MRIGLIGLGYWGSKYLRLLRELSNVKVAFVADIDPTRLVEIPSADSLPMHDDPREALQTTAPDAVIVATPASTHLKVARECLENGVHVLVEKPLTLSLDDALALFRLSQESNCLLYPGHVYSHNDVVKALADRTRQASFGDIRYAICRRTGLGPIRGDVNVMWDLAPHDLTILHSIGLSKPDSVTAMGTSFLQPGVEDVAFATLRYHGGSIAHIQLSWLDPYKVRQVTVVGRRQMAVFDDVTTEDRLRIYERGVDVTPASGYGEFKAQIRTGDVQIPCIAAREPLRNMLEAFIRACKNPRSASNELLQGILIVAIIEAMERSVHLDGSPVKLDWNRVRSLQDTLVETAATGS